MKRWIWNAYLLVSLINYFLFLFVLPYSFAPYFQYSGIVLNAIIALSFAWSKAYSKDLVLALVGTVVADLFLLFPNGNRIIGTAVFAVVQGLYAWFLHDNLSSNNEVKQWKMTRIILSFAILLFAWFIAPIEIRLLLMVGGLYGIQLVMNVVLSLRLSKKLPWMALGMVFFLGCDVFVALSSVQAYLPSAVASLPLIQAYYASPYNWIWFFYYPSQMLLVTTALWPRNKKKEVS